MLFAFYSCGVSDFGFDACFLLVFAGELKSYIHHLPERRWGVSVSFSSLSVPGLRTTFERGGGVLGSQLSRCSAGVLPCVALTRVMDGVLQAGW